MPFLVPQGIITMNLIPIMVHMEITNQILIVKLMILGIKQELVENVMVRKHATNAMVLARFTVLLMVSISI